MEMRRRRRDQRVGSEGSGGGLFWRRRRGRGRRLSLLGREEASLGRRQCRWRHSFLECQGSSVLLILCIGGILNHSHGGVATVFDLVQTRFELKQSRKQHTSVCRFCGSREARLWLGGGRLRSRGLKEDQTMVWPLCFCKC